ncbi:MAG: hypothetical protein EA387_09905 [Nitriliruptor sp.]|nr:MAG: hypothetical protein EA387_09905 [Nitriliruptor sp.]
MGRRFITARDIDDLLVRGEQELVVDAATVLTDLAREHARDRGVRVVTADGPRVTEDVVAERPPAVTQTAAAPRPTPSATGLPRDPGGEVSPATASAASRASQVREGEEGPSRRQLRAAVRAAVIAELGTTPPGIDAAIGRVLDRFDVRG